MYPQTNNQQGFSTPPSFQAGGPQPNRGPLPSLDEAFDLNAGGITAFNKHSQVGDMVEGPILSANERQATDYNTRALEWWPDGNPKMQVAITIQTQERGADDDGKRTVYVKGWGGDRAALIDAIRNAGFSRASEGLAEGNIFAAKFVGYEATQSGNDRKVYAYRITPQTGVDQALNMGDSAPQTPPQATQGPAPTQQPSTQQAPPQRAYQGSEFTQPAPF